MLLIVPLCSGREHIPDGAYFPYSFLGNDYKSAPHLSGRTIGILYFISAIDNSTVRVEESYFFDGKRSCPRGTRRAPEHPLHS